MNLQLITLQPVEREIQIRAQTLIFTFLSLKINESKCSGINFTRAHFRA